MKKILFITTVLFLTLLSFAEARQYSFQGLSGTGTYPAQANLALDGWPVAGDAGPPVVPALSDGDLAYGYDDLGNFCAFEWIAASSTAESLVIPYIVNPNDNAASGRWVQTVVSAAGIETLKTQYSPTASMSHSEGLIYYDSTKKAFVLYNEESEVSQEIGREGYIRVYNDTGVDILDGKVCYLSGITSDAFEVSLASNTTASTSLGTIGFATHTIEDGTYGYITRWGTIHNLNTIGLTNPNILYLASTPGGYTEDIPESPNYLVRLGQVGVVDAANGTIEVNVSVGSNTQDVIKIFNGAVLEDTTTNVSSNGTVVTLSYEKNGGGDLSLFFDGGFDIFDSTPAATIALTAGSDTTPTLNYVYIPKSTMLLTSSTVGFPSEQHVPVATVLVQSAASAQTYGLYKVHAWTDHLSASVGQGHLSHVNYWIRNQNSTWLSGVMPTTSITVNGGAIDNVYFSNTSGTVLQMHDHSFPARDMELLDPIYVVNDFTTKYDRITDLSDIAVDSDGDTLRSNNTYYSLVIWGSVSESETDSKIYCNVPSGSYISAVGAIDDINRFSNYAIPTQFKGTGFLIARIVLRYQTSGSGTITEILTEDLRGLQPSTSPGAGGAIAGSEFSDNLFRIFNVTDNTKKLEFNLSTISALTTRTWTVPDIDIDFTPSTGSFEGADTAITKSDENETITGDWTFDEPITAAGFTSSKVSGVGGSIGLNEVNSTDTNKVGYYGPPNITESFYHQFPNTQPSGSFYLWSTPAGTSGPDNSKLSTATLYSVADLKALETTGSFSSPITANPYSLTAALSYDFVLYYGATGEIDLPAGVDGMSGIIYNTGAFTITIDPNGSEGVVRDGTLQTGGVSFTLSPGAGNFVGIVFDGTQWVTKGYKGTLAEGS